MRSAAKAAYSAMRGPDVPASRILSASTSDRYSFFLWGDALTSAVGTVLNIAAINMQALMGGGSRMGHLKDLASPDSYPGGGERASRKGRSAPFGDRCALLGKTGACPLPM